MKIEDLKEGMDDVNLEAEIDYVVPKKGSYSNNNWGIVYVKDDTKDIKMLFFDEALKKAKEGKKIRVKHGYVTSYKGQLQLNTKKEYPIEYIDE
jgi:ssDNA-binding replication factor A large subunit